jgi:hypothetical protein
MTRCRGRCGTVVGVDGKHPVSTALHDLSEIV